MGIGIGEGLLGFLFIWIVFLLCREIFCWYWKINEQTELLKSINKNLEELSFHLRD